MSLCTMHIVLCLYVHAAKMLEAYKYTACLSVRLRCIWSVRIRTTHAYRWLQTNNKAQQYTQYKQEGRLAGTVGQTHIEKVLSIA